MTKIELIQQFEKSQEEYIHVKEKKYLKDNSQFFTPSEIARKMIETINLDYYKGLNSIKILEPSAGCGILILHIVLYLIENTNIEYINIDIFESDNSLCYILNKNLSYLNNYLKVNTNVTLTTKLINKNFILESYNNWNSNKTKYNIVISNPPFKKINQNSEEVTLLKDIVYGQPNIYIIFIFISLRLLDINGTYIVISPRNYLIGQYAKKLRAFIFDNYSLSHIHSFANRNIFKCTNQEVIISTFINNKICKNIVISHNGKFKFKTNINKIIYDQDTLSLMIPKSKDDIFLLEKFSKFKMLLENLSIKISVGPIVQFRNEVFLSREIYSDSKAPLLISNDIRENNTLYYFQRENTRKTHNKSISINAKRLLRNSNYLLLRKVTAKDDRNTIISTVLEKEYFNHKYLGLDNNLMYFHKLDKNKDLTKEECYGLYCYINSNYFKEYYSLINGTHTINVSDFSNIRFPELQTIIKMGTKVMRIKKYDREICSKILNKYADLE